MTEKQSRCAICGGNITRITESFVDVEKDIWKHLRCHREELNKEELNNTILKANDRQRG